MTFQKGRSGNPTGRRAGIEEYFTKLQKAIKHVEKAKGKKILIHAVEQAYEDNQILNALLKKLLPDISSTELQGTINAQSQLILIRASEQNQEQKVIDITAESKQIETTESSTEDKPDEAIKSENNLT
jgi:hypothetical protein